jgi:hypothetical protein
MPMPMAWPVTSALASEASQTTSGEKASPLAGQSELEGAERLRYGDCSEAAEGTRTLDLLHGKQTL